MSVVNIYQWDDVNAPKLNKTTNCLQMILKACLVTGYGTKQGAGWTSEFDNIVSGVTVLRPKQNAEQDFYLRLSADNGAQMTAQVYLTMNDANTGDLKLQGATPFKYAKNNSTGKWLLLATERNFWFFCEQRFASQAAVNDAKKTGAYFFCGDTLKNSDGYRAIALNHTGGVWEDGDYAGVAKQHRNILTGSTSFNFNDCYLPFNLYDCFAKTVSKIVPMTLFDGLSTYDTNAILSPLILNANTKLYQLPGLYIPANPAMFNNFDKTTVFDGSVKNMIIFATAGCMSSNCLIKLDVWS